jgi:hypothetical protein
MQFYELRDRHRLPHLMWPRPLTGDAPGPRARDYYSTITRAQRKPAVNARPLLAKVSNMLQSASSEF